MTLMAFLLLIILFLVAFLYFSGLNPQEITLYYLPDQSVTFSVAIIVVGCILFGLILGYLAHLYSTVRHLLKHWRRERNDKKTRDVSALYREGVVHLLSGDIKNAHSLLQKALDRDPSRVDTLIALANVHIQEGERQEGVNLLLKAKAIEPRSLEVLFKLAATYEEMGKEEDAVRTYDEVLDIDRDNRKALRGQRDLHIRHSRWKEALEHQKKIIKGSAGSSRLEEEKKMLLFLRYEVARLALEEGELESGKSELKDIIKQAPDFIPARVSIGDVYRLQGRAEESARAWQEGYRDLGKSVFLSRLEDLYMEAEDPATLLSFYRSALMEKGDDLMLRLFFGKLCLRLEMIDEAMEQLDAVECAGADFPQLHLLLAEGHRRRNRIDESIREYKRAFDVSPRLRLGYLCDVCGEEASEWQSRCPECGTWGSFSLAGRQQIRSVRPPEVREIRHGEREIHLLESQPWNEE